MADISLNIAATGDDAKRILKLLASNGDLGVTPQPVTETEHPAKEVAPEPETEPEPEPVVEPETVKKATKRKYKTRRGSWTEEMDAKLLKMRLAGHKHSAIARKLNKTEKATSERLRRIKPKQSKKVQKKLDKVARTLVGQGGGRRRKQ